MVKELLQIRSTASIDPAQSVLLLEVGENHLYQGVFNTGNKQLEQAAFYYTDPHQLPLGQLIEEQAELRNAYYQTIISYAFPESILVPEKYYRFEEAQNLLDDLYGKQPFVTLIADHIGEAGLHNIYNVPSPLFEMVNRQYRSAKSWHTYSVGIKNIEKPDDEAPQLVINFTPQQVMIFVVKHNIIQLAQTYAYTTPMDVLYYALKVCSNLGILQHEVRVKLEGLIDEESAVYKKLHEYFVHIGFAALPADLRLHDDLANHPVHFYSTLVKLAACVS